MISANDPFLGGFLGGAVESGTASLAEAAVAGGLVATLDGFGAGLDPILAELLVPIYGFAPLLKPDPAGFPLDPLILLDVCAAEGRAGG